MYSRLNQEDFMQTIVCDICKKKVEDAFTGRTFFYFAEHSICEDCKNNLELQAKSTIRTKEPFTFDWFDKYIDESITKSKTKAK